MRNGKKKKIIISAACIIVVGLLIAGVYMYRLRNREYPIIKNIKLNGENYVREIYPEVEIRYPKVVVDEDSKEYVGTYKLENRCANSNDNEKINKIFDTDEGARYVGEFSFGVNPFVTKPMKDILFDEKIRGSIHFTPGSCYEDAYNGNESAIHWDLVYIQTPEYGGGEIYLDDVLIRKDGKFVLPELECLNPENLI